MGVEGLKGCENAVFQELSKTNAMLVGNRYIIRN